MQQWVEQVMREWLLAFGHSCHFGVGSVGPIDTWVQLANSGWAYQWGPSDYVEIHVDSLDCSVRRAVERTIHAVIRHDHSQQPSETVEAWLREDAYRPTVELLREWELPQTEATFSQPQTIELSGGGDWQGQVPGYFVWIRFAASLRASDVSETVEEIIREFLRPEQLEWISGETPSILLYQSLHSLDMYDETFGSPTGGEADATEEETMSFRVLLQALVAALESDGSVLANVIVSELVRHPAWRRRAITSLTLVRRMAERRRAVLTTTGIAPFSDFIAEFTVAALPQAAKQACLAAATSRLPDAAFPLSEDMARTLEGMIAANLNISEAARKLYMHRNTLLHRMDRLYADTGFDIRRFDDAMALFVAHQLSIREEVPNSSQHRV
ncbi:MAG: helix-turn-helix domain-containing protein [Alicyclobacillaceae bacterium]|nr:helix-turn-helix domain-containing protein [Alicyclobacillaceae bacterium]